MSGSKESSKFQSLRRIIPGAVLLILLGMGLWFAQHWYESLPTVQAQKLTSARARWSNRAFDAYQLEVEYTASRQASGAVARRSTSYQVQHDVGTRFGGGRGPSVAEYFEMIDYHVNLRITDPSADTRYVCKSKTLWCQRATTRRIRVTYDDELGYPQTIEFSRTRHPDWFNVDFWRWLWQSSEWRGCENLLCTTTEQEIITITKLTPQP